MKLKSKYPWVKTCRLFLPLLTITLLLIASCSQEQLITPGGKTGEDEALVTLSLKVPAATRSLTETEEEAVKIIHVLAFKDGIYKYSASSTNTTDHKTFQITLRKGTWDLVVFANSSSAMTGLTVGASQTELLNGLTKSINVAEGWKITDLRTTGIPMSSSVLTNKVIDDNTAIGTIGEGNGIALYRMVAKADVAIASTAQAKFKLASVRVYNYNSKGRISPNATNVQTINLPSAPEKIKGITDADKLLYAATSETECTREIYLNESSNPKDLSGMPLDDRTCLVVGGRYDTDSDPTYYRVDFSRVNGNKDDYLDIIRNHHYTFNITKVDGRGYGDENTAFESRPSNMTVEVTRWNQEEINDIITDGQYGLGVNHKAFTFSKDLLSDQIMGGVNELLALTNYTGNWSVTVKNSDNTTDATYSTDASWLTVKAQSNGSTAYTVTVTGNTQQRFFIFATKNTGSIERTAYIHVKVKKLVQVIKITQTTKAKTNIVLKSGADEVTELVWDNRNAYATQSFTATWLPIDKQCSITKFNGIGGVFEYSLPSAGLGSATTQSGGTQTYIIKPVAIRASDPGYPFIDRSALQTYTITNGETTISKSIILRQKNYALLPTRFESYAMPEVLKTATIRCNTDWIATATVGAELLYSFTPSGVADTAEVSNNFNYKFASGKYGKVTFTFSPKTTGHFASVQVTVESKPYIAFDGHLGWAGCNIYWDGGKLTFDPAGDRSKENYQGVYFKWGGLVAISPTVNSWASANASSYIIFAPKPDLLSDNMQYVSMPCLTSFTNNDLSRDFVSENHNPDANLGDICKYITDMGWAPPGKWRLPTAIEFKIDMHNYNFNSVGEFEVLPSNDSEGKMSIGSGKRTTIDNNGKPFFPATGYRGSDGDVYYQGTKGQYFSSTPKETARAHTVEFTKGNTNWDSSANTHAALPVRCVRQL